MGQKVGFGFFPKIKIYKFNDNHLPIKLPEPIITGKDTRCKRFILIYKNENEKKFYTDLLGIDGKKVIYSLKDFTKDK